MLLGRVNRQDRLAIVREVESQIHDLLQDRDPESLDREDVLAVLARLDPPEAYLPDEHGESSTGRLAASDPASGRRANSDSSRLSQASGIVGLVSIGHDLRRIAIGLHRESGRIPNSSSSLGSYPAIGLTFLLGVIATTLAGYARLRGAWADRRPGDRDHLDDRPRMVGSVVVLIL